MGCWEAKAEERTLGAPSVTLDLPVAVPRSRSRSRGAGTLWVVASVPVQALRYGQAHRYVKGHYVLPFTFDASNAQFVPLLSLVWAGARAARPVPTLLALVRACKVPFNFTRVSLLTDHGLVCALSSTRMQERNRFQYTMEREETRTVCSCDILACSANRLL